MPTNRLITRMLELDGDDDVESVVKSPPAAGADGDQRKQNAVVQMKDQQQQQQHEHENEKGQAIPDYSGFDQSWFLGSAKATPETETTGLEQSNPSAEVATTTVSTPPPPPSPKSPAPRASMCQGAASTRQILRSWSCNFL